MWQPPTLSEQSIVYIRDYNLRGQEVSGYIDYANRLKSESFETYFEAAPSITKESSKLGMNSATSTQQQQPKTKGTESPVNLPSLSPSRSGGKGHSQDTNHSKSPDKSNKNANSNNSNDKNSNNSSNNYNINNNINSKKFLPKSTDLSFYNWETQMCTANSTSNFQVLTENEIGMLFRNKRDRKVVNVDPKVRPAICTYSAIS